MSYVLSMHKDGSYFDFILIPTLCVGQRVLLNLYQYDRISKGYQSA
jgi:hypothetical protein